jgi:hypothetical protein
MQMISCRLLELAPIDYGPANGFLHTYRAYCCYYNTPVSPDIMQYVTDLVYANVMDFSVGDCPGISTLLIPIKTPTTD